MQEMWINNKNDAAEFFSYMHENNLGPLRTSTDAEGLHVFHFKDMIVHCPVKYIQGDNVLEMKEYDPLIFGKDNTERIVNITVDNDEVFIYKADGTVDHREYQNWAVGCDYHDGAMRLKGNQYFKYIKEMPEDQFYRLKDSWNPRIWTPRTASEGFMLRSGMTYYKGMKVNEISLLSFDIETTSLDKDVEHAEVVLLSATYRSKTGEIQKRLFDIFDYDFKEDMWEDIEAYVQKTNPDIILGHNILIFDLPYADKNSTGLNWGRNNSRIFFDEKASKIRKDGSQQYDYFNANINGREIVDTFVLSLKYDIGREFPSYGLKAIEKHLGLVKEDRSWDFNNWPVSRLLEERRSGSELGKQKWQEFRIYCGDDSDSPIAMFDLMIPAFFYLTQSVPKTLQQVVNEASGSQLDALMIRSYLQDGNSLPKTSQKVEFEGAVSMGVPGIYNNVRKVDVASLYPSIMLQYEIYDNKKDPNRHMLKMLEYFRDERLKNKKLAKETGDRYYDDMQNAQKIMINSMYGFMGAGYLLFNYPAGAADVTRYGREILLKGVEWSTGHTLQKVIKAVRNAGTEDEEERFEWILGDKVCDGKGYQLVNVDTDSFSYTNNIAPTKDEFTAEIKELNTLYPELIKWENDGIWDKIIVVKAKNYVLRKDGKVKYKGSSLRDQKKEPRLLKLLEEFLSTLLSDKNAEERHELLLQQYNACCREVTETFDVKQWVTKKTVTAAVLNAKRQNEQKQLDAINEAISKGILTGAQEGDKVWFYTAIDGMIQDTNKDGPVIVKKTGLPKMVENCVLRVPQLYNGDHDMWHYVERVYKTLVILENVIDIEKFTKYHNTKNRKLLVP